MQRTRIKICGIHNSGALRAAVEAGADAIGLVFAAGSPRYLTPAQARSLVHELPPFIEPVGLFVNESVEMVRALAQEVGLASVQLHGGESAYFARSLKPMRVIKAIPFDEKSVESLEEWRNDAVAGLLWDAPPSSSKPGEQGGGGKRFDWSALAALRPKMAGTPPMILAGGLTPQNVGEAIRTLRPHAVDVSSGVESSRGIKDSKLIHAFCEAVRAADAELESQVKQ